MKAGLGIGILCAALPSKQVGGAELQALALARALADRYRITVFARGNAADAERWAPDGVKLVLREVLPVPGIRLMADIAKAAHQIRQHRDRLDVLVSFQILAPGLIGSIACRRLQLPHVVWIRSQQEFQMDTLSRFRLVAPHVLGSADRVLVQAETLRTEVLAAFDRPHWQRLHEHLRTHIHVVPNGVEQTAPREGTGRHLLYVGRLVEGKGLFDLLRVFNRLANQDLHLIGDGPLRPALEAAAAGSAVTFHGTRTQREVRALLSDAKLLVLPSESEGMPNAILEAMSLGVPVVATRVGAIPTLVEHDRTGLLVEPRNEEALYQSLARLSQSPELCAEMGARAREAAARFSWPVVAERLVEILSPLTHNNPT